MPAPKRLRKTLDQHKTPLERRISGETDTLSYEERERVKEAREDYLSFVKYTFQEDKYRVNWHHEKIAEEVEKWADPDSGLDRLIISVPPQHGKTTLTSRHLTPYILGENPDARIIGGSADDDLSKDLSRDAKRIVRSESYQRVFPETQIPDRHVVADDRHAYKNTSDHWEIVGHYGSYRGYGAGQRASSASADYVIIDDPLSRTDAESAAGRDEVDRWWKKSIRPRLSNVDKVLIVMTRWHLDDLAGRIMRRAKSNQYSKEWKYVKIKALADEDPPEWDPREPGEALWPWHKSRKELLAFKEDDETAFAALYQGEPVPEGGGILKRKYFEDRWRNLPTPGGEFLWSVDPKGGSTRDSSSEAVIQLWYFPPDSCKAYLLDQKSGIWSESETIDQMKALWQGEHWGLWTRPATKLVEDKADGPGIRDHLQGEIPGITLFDPGTKSKPQRGRDIERYCRSGDVVLPVDDHALWVRSTVEQLVTFPGSVLDDRFDALTQALIWKFRRQTEEKNESPHWAEAYGR